MDSIQQNGMLNKLAFANMELDEEVFAKSIGKVLMTSRTIKELNMSHIGFNHPKSFYDVCAAILNDRCRLNTLKFKGISIGQLEGKIIQYILMKNKSINTLDLSNCRADNPDNFEFFLQQLNQFCNIRFLTIENLQPDIS